MDRLEINSIGYFQIIRPTADVFVRLGNHYTSEWGLLYNFSRNFNGMVVVNRMERYNRDGFVWIGNYWKRMPDLVKSQQI